MSQPTSISTSTPTTDPIFTSDPTLTPRFNVPWAAYLEANPTITHKGTAFKVKHIAVGAIVISPAAAAAATTTTTSNGSNTTWTTTTTEPHPTRPPNPKVLLLRRAASDSMPNLWEVPGGSVDAEDASILHGTARELLEESGLHAVRVGPLVRAVSGSRPNSNDEHKQSHQQHLKQPPYDDEGQVFLTRSGNLVAKFHFLVEIAEGCEGDVRCDPEEHSEWLWATEREVEDHVVDGKKVHFTTVEQWEAILEGFRVWRRLREGGDAQE